MDVSVECAGRTSIRIGCVCMSGLYECRYVGNYVSAIESRTIVC